MNLLLRSGPISLAAARVGPNPPHGKIQAVIREWSENQPWRSDRSVLGRQSVHAATCSQPAPAASNQQFDGIPTQVDGIPAASDAPWVHALLGCLLAPCVMYFQPLAWGGFMAVWLSIFCMHSKKSSGPRAQGRCLLAGCNGLLCVAGWLAGAPAAVVRALRIILFGCCRRNAKRRMAGCSAKV